MLTEFKKPARIDARNARDAVLGMDPLPVAMWHSGDGSVEKQTQVMGMHDVDSPSDATQPGLGRKHAAGR